MNKNDLYYGEATRRTNEQYESKRHFDSMATQILGFSAVVFSLLIFDESDYNALQIALFSLSLVFFILVAISTIRVLWLRGWSFSPPLPAMYKNLGSDEYNDESLYLWAGNCLSESLENNENTLDSKAKWLRFSYLSSALEVITIGILVLVTVI